MLGQVVSHKILFVSATMWYGFFDMFFDDSVTYIQFLLTIFSNQFSYPTFHFFLNSIYDILNLFLKKLSLIWCTVCRVSSFFCLKSSFSIVFFRRNECSLTNSKLIFAAIFDSFNQESTEFIFQKKYTFCDVKALFQNCLQF